MSGSYVSTTLRRTVIERSGNCCEYCRISQTDQFFAFEVDHIIAENMVGRAISKTFAYRVPIATLIKAVTSPPLIA